MRLRAEEVAVIERLVAEAYGPAARVRLFGSQVDDTRKGGDIDLLVELPEDAARDLGAELRLHAALEEALDERKVDLIVHQGGDEEGPFVRIAKRTGILLPSPASSAGASDGDRTGATRRPTMTTAEELLLDIFRTLARTGEALKRLRVRLADRLPARPETVAAFDEDTRFLTDALLKRFEQHTDGLRAAARTVVRLSGEEDKSRTVRQVLDRLESLGVVPEAARFMALVDLRNRTTHAYAPESARQAEILNSVYASLGELLDLACRLARFVRDQKLLPEAEAGSVLDGLAGLAATS
jgi:predicted nucleotidyltransferase/uncharacterized protein YutE (UPF0331/DUF86 family)